MNSPVNTNHGACLRLTMSDLVKEALEKDQGKTSVVLYIVPRQGQPAGATHAIYQGIPGRNGEDHPESGLLGSTAATPSRKNSNMTSHCESPHRL